MKQSTRVLIAFASVYVFWGSTYGAIHIAEQQLPVPVVAAARSLVTVSIIIATPLLRGGSLRVPADERWKLVLVGLLFMSGNSMLLTLGETMVPTGFASLILKLEDGGLMTVAGNSFVISRDNGKSWPERRAIYE